MDSVASRYAIALLSVARDNNQIKEIYLLQFWLLE